MTGSACSACGRAFGCGVDAGDCWCAGVDTDPATLAAMAGAYSGCLCPDCLRAAASGRAAPPQPEPEEVHSSARRP